MTLYDFRTVLGDGQRPTWRRALLAGALIAALGVAVPTQASAAPPLTEIGDAASWSGSLSNAAAPVPDLCTPLSCRTYEVRLELPSGTWERAGGLQVSLRWPKKHLDVGYDLDLYVYGPDGKLVADSANVIYSVAEGAWIQDPANGRYRIVVVARDVVGTVPFDVVAHTRRGWGVETTASFLGGGDALNELTPYQPQLVFPGREPARPKPMLPDLRPVKARNFHIESTLAVNFYQASQRVPAHQPSCYPQETAGLNADELGSQEGTPLRCLRWDLAIDNIGRGPWEVRAYPDSETPESAYQAVYRSDGTYTLHEVGEARYSNAHGHIHFKGMDEVGLYEIRADGSRGDLVRELGDKGICAIDLINPSFGTAADGPPRYVIPGTCDTNDNQDPNDPLYPEEQYLRTGMSAGWRDIYPWFIPDQYIDITDVPDGQYLLIYRANASRTIRETNFRNNVSHACVEFHGTEASRC